jgi:hypothetical protein
LGTSVAEKASFVSRFLYKILEIMGAAVATAVSGYIVAHMGGFLPSQNRAPTPPEVVAAPSEHSAPKSAPTTLSPSQAATSQTPTAPQPTQSASTPAASETKPSVSQSEPTGSAIQTVVRKTAKTQPVRKSNKADTAAGDSGKPRESADVKSRDAAEAKLREAADAKAREAAEAKPRDGEDKESVEARVRAALANVDANRPAPPAEVPPPRRGEGQTGMGAPRLGDSQQGSAVATPSRPLELPSAPGGGGQQPRSADLGSTAQQPAALQSPVVQPAALSGPAPGQSMAPPASEALTTVEIKSRPVAAVDTPRAPEAAPSPPPEERGVFQTLKNILPDFSRPAAHDETPRPPAPVGE